MCEICRQIPCHPRCPNASDPEPEYRCSECGDGVFPGMEYLKLDDGSVLCKDCLDGKSLTEILEIFGEKLKTA